MTAAVVSAFAFFAIGVANGEDINQGADFEATGFVEGEQFNAGLSDDAQSTGDKYWYTEDTEADNVISNHSGAVGAPRPDKFASDANNKFLKVETSGRLWRSVKNNGGSSDFLTNTTASLNVYGHSIADSAIYLDTLVKFTPADSDFSSDLTDGDKIAISYVEREEERDSNNNVTVEAATNFVIRAGLIVGTQLFQTNYYAYLPDDPSLENFDKDAWHRLTVRTIPDVGDGSVGFVVYVDETNLTYSTSVDAGFGTLNATAQGFYNNEKHALFPSAVGSGAGKLMISAASFSGNGSIDDVVFTTTTPTFIASSEAVSATFTADSGVTAISVKVGEADPVAVDMTAETLTAMLPAGTTAFTVTATIADTYDFVEMTVGDAVYNTNPANITGYAGGEIAITTTRNNFNLFDAGGDPISGTYQTLGAALAATGVAKIQLAYDYNVVASDILNGYVDIDQSTTIDLNGKKLDGGTSVDSPLFMVNDGNFVIIDSVGGGKVVYDGPGIVYGATAYIGATSGDLGPTFDGQLFYDGGEGYIIRGKFDETSNTASGAEPAFLYLDYLGDGDSVESECTGLVAGYWVVAPKGGGDEDWKDPSEITKDAIAGDVYGITGELAAADAIELTKWATGNGKVNFADKDTIKVDCFLLNIANDSTAQQIQEEKDEFVVTISFDSNGDPVISAPDGKTYNGKLIIKGSDDLSIPKANWDEQTDGDTFFYGELSL